MKTVIYKKLGDFYTTPEDNFNANLTNARLVHKAENFETPEEIIEYYCKWFSSTREDFIIHSSCKEE